eukprot:s1080_g3.t1
MVIGPTLLMLLRTGVPSRRCAPHCAASVAALQQTKDPRDGTCPRTTTQTLRGLEHLVLPRTAPIVTDRVARARQARRLGLDVTNASVKCAKVKEKLPDYKEWLRGNSKHKHGHAQHCTLKKLCRKSWTKVD